MQHQLTLESKVELKCNKFYNVLFEIEKLEYIFGIAETAEIVFQQTFTFLIYLGLYMFVAPKTQLLYLFGKMGKYYHIKLKYFKCLFKINKCFVYISEKETDPLPH